MRVTLTTERPRYEYKVISTVATGCPLGDGETHHARLESGLNELGQDGWLLVETIGTTLMVFARETCDTSRPQFPRDGNWKEKGD